MKKFLRRKLFGKISVAVIAVVIAVMMIAGGAYAAWVATHITSNAGTIVIRGVTQTYSLSATVLDWTIPAIIDPGDSFDCTAQLTVTNTGNQTLNNAVLTNITNNGDVTTLGGVVTAALEAPVAKNGTGKIDFKIHVPSAPASGSYGVGSVAMDLNFN